MGELIGKWNYYFLRYGAGTIVGAAIIAFFSKQFANSHCQWILTLISAFGGIKSEAATLTVYTALGFTYCYVSSAPGTVFHATRGLFNPHLPRAKRSHCLITWLIGVFLIVISISIVFLNSYSPTVFDISERDLNWKQLCGVGVFAFIMLLQLTLLFFCFFKFPLVAHFYQQMTRERSRKENNIQNYRTSYRDLREHGNAFEVIILELVLASALLSFTNYIPLIIIIWILPAALCWVIGTMLEFRIPKPIPNSPKP
jgi:hypothetical protein